MLENLSAMELVNSMTTKQVKNLFNDGLESQNALMISTAIKVVAKRGDYDFIAKAVTDYLESGNSFKLNSGFAIALSNIMFDVRNACPVLGSVGKEIARRSSREDGGVYDSRTLNEDIQSFHQKNDSQK
jgi:hypothetical protein